MNNYTRYFHDIYKAECVLAEHGFKKMPDETELLFYIFSLEDRLKELENGKRLPENSGGTHG